jgi:hypothetical protein
MIWYLAPWLLAALISTVMAQGWQFSTSGAVNTPATAIFGVNMSSTERPACWYSQANPFGTSSDWSYLQGKGINLARQAVAWENIQSTFNGALNTTFMSQLQGAITGANAAGIKSIVDLHNFGAYVQSSYWSNCTYSYAGNAGIMTCNPPNASCPTTPTALPGLNAIGDGTLTASVFGNVWGKIAQTLAGTAGLAGYGLMNEPCAWNFKYRNCCGPTTAQPPQCTLAVMTSFYQAAITAIRTYDTVTPIYVMLPGDSYILGTGSNGNGINDTADFSSFIAGLTDSSHLLRAEWHSYDDTPCCSGTDNGGGSYNGNYASYGYTSSTSPTQNSVRLISPFVTNYCAAAGGQNCLVGEFGWPNDYSSGYSGGSVQQWWNMGILKLNYQFANNLGGTWWNYITANAYRTSGGPLSLNPGNVHSGDDERLSLLGTYRK